MSFRPFVGRAKGVSCPTLSRVIRHSVSFVFGVLCHSVLYVIIVEENCMNEIIGELLPFSILILVPIITLWPTVTMSVDRVCVGRATFKGLTLSVSVFNGTRYRCRCMEFIVGYKVSLWSVLVSGIVLIVRRSAGRMALRPVWICFPRLGIIK